jgi:hypothetical protein
MSYKYIASLIFDLLFLMILTLILIAYPWGRFHTGYNEAASVHIKKEDGSFQLYRNGKPFYIKGASGNSNFEALANMGGNTIRVYDTLNLVRVLDTATKNGLAVIIDIPLPEYDEQFNEYEDDLKNEERKTKVKHFVQEYRDHPALLFWNLGNEVRYPVRLFPNKFIDTFNALIDIIHTEDPNHLVSTTVQRRMDILAIARHSPNLDLLGYNIFGTVKNIRFNIESINSVLSGSFPYYISEWGIDGFWETGHTKWGASIEPTTTKKNEQLRHRYNNYILNAGDNCQGSLVFHWGQKHECTYTWFNLFGEDGKTSEMVLTLNNLWKGLGENENEIGLDYMLVNGLGAMDNIILSPETLATAELKFKKKFNDSIRISWELYPDYCRLESISKAIKEPQQITDAIASKSGLTARFETPREEGSYRLYAYIENQDGFVATCNTPFYVLGAIDE